ncbi:MAG: glycosyl hydrolase family 18 protein [Saprospiraceae bacterium]|nr:glycosyl hydrolase family 18 protein [Saprospiraceae bacterium]
MPAFRCKALIFFLTTHCILCLNHSRLEAQSPAPSLVGYWHNWNDAAAPYLSLPSVDSRYNVVQVAFALPQAGTDYHMTFVPDQVSTATFASQVAALQSQGKKVLISIGGATAPISLDNDFERNTFVTTMQNLLNTYGFDGIDIDLEGSSVTVSGGSIVNPTDTKIINLIQATRQIMSAFHTARGKKMWLTMAPETAFVQGGMAAYGSIWGAYLPVIHALRDSLDILHVQLYNSGSMYGIDGNIYSQGTADFILSMTEAVIQGFNTAGGFFQGLPPEKVAVGLPACPSAAGGGYISPQVVKSALDYLRGLGPKPGTYQLAQFGGYPTLRGMMTWSINWDAVSTCSETYEFANSFTTCFDDSTYYAMRFTASATSSQADIDRVVIPIDNPNRPVDVGNDFTLEFWMKAQPGDNTASACSPGQWYTGNILVDRDVFGDGDHGDYGVALCDRRLVVGVQRGNLTHSGVSGSVVVDDGVWHHVAITRQATNGGVSLYIDGVLDATSATGASTGDISYRDGRPTTYPDDPTLVLGAEKQDLAGSLHFKGRMDEFRISSGLRYASSFTKPWKPFNTDNATKGLYHFDEGSGTTLTDFSNASGGPSTGTIQYGSGTAGPYWTYDTPFQNYFEVTNTLDSGTGSLRNAVATAPAGSLIVFAPHLNNQSIVLSSSIVLPQNVIIRDLNVQPVTITISGNGPVISVPSGRKAVLWNTKILSGSGVSGRAITNLGTLVLRNATITDTLPGTGSSVLNQGVVFVQENSVID